jgi:ribosome-binding factor A
MPKHTRRPSARGAHGDASDHASGRSGGAGHRHARLEHILSHEVEALIHAELVDPALSGLRVVSVLLSPDGSHVRVAYAIEGMLGDEHRLREASRSALTRATGFVRSRLAQQLQLRRMPRLSFNFVGVAEPGATGPHPELEGGAP